MAALAELQKQKSVLKLQIKKMQEEEADDEVIEPIHKQYQDVSKQIKDLETGSPAAAPASPAPASNGNRDALEREKNDLKAQIKAAQQSGKSEEEIQPLYERYTRIKARLDATGGPHEISVAPAASPAVRAAEKVNLNTMSVEELRAEKDTLKTRVKRMQESGAGDDAVAPVFARYNEVKAALERAERNASAAPASVAPVAAAAPANPEASQNLYNAAKKGDLTAVRDALAAGGSHAFRDKRGATPLAIASYHGHCEVARVLIDAGADVDAAAEKGATPLYVAAQKGHLDVVKLLLERRATVDAARANNNTALWIAAHEGDVPVISLLLSRGANIEAAKSDGITPLSVAVEKQRLDAVKTLLARGANVNSADNEGFTPLHVASFSDQREMAALLLDNNANMELKTVLEGHTPVEIAASTGRREIVKLLITRGCVVKPDGEVTKLTQNS